MVAKNASQNWSFRIERKLQQGSSQVGTCCLLACVCVYDLTRESRETRSLHEAYKRMPAHAFRGMQGALRGTPLHVWLPEAVLDSSASNVLPYVRFAGTLASVSKLDADFLVLTSSCQHRCKVDDQIYSSAARSFLLRCPLPAPDQQRSD